MGRREGRRMSLLQETLRRLVEAMYPVADGTMSPTTDEIVNHLRSTYSDYHRTKQQTLTRFVEEALQSIRKHHERRILSRKKRKKIAEGEATLQKSPSTSSDSASESDVAPSELSFDLTTTILRNSYMEKNVELEVGKGTSIVNAGGVGSEVETKLKLARKQLNGNGGSGSDVEVEGKNVIRFSDLGGIDKVMQELNLLLLPIKHPEVARKLRVRPTSGLLFHGPLLAVGRQHCFVP